jgi:hypothetical protein
MLGSGTVTCTRARHDLAAGEQGAARRFEGTVDHLDGALWPVRGNDRVQTGISIVRGGGYTPVPGSSSRDQSACFPLRAEGGVRPAALTLRVSRLFGDAGGQVTLSRMVEPSPPELGQLVGEGRLMLVVRGRTTMTFEVRGERP